MSPPKNLTPYEFKSNLQFVKKVPAFLSNLYEQQEPTATIDSKRSEKAAALDSEEFEGEEELGADGLPKAWAEKEDEKPQIVALASGDLTKEQVDAHLSGDVVDVLDEGMDGTDGHKEEVSTGGKPTFRSAKIRRGNEQQGNGMSFSTSNKKGNEDVSSAIGSKRKSKIDGNDDPEQETTPRSKETTKKKKRKKEKAKISLLSFQMDD